MAPTKVFSCEYCKMFKNIFFYRTTSVAASAKFSIVISLIFSSKSYNKTNFVICNIFVASLPAVPSTGLSFIPNIHVFLTSIFFWHLVVTELISVRPAEHKFIIYFWWNPIPEEEGIFISHIYLGKYLTSWGKNLPEGKSLFHNLNMVGSWHFISGFLARVRCFLIHF